MPLGHAQARNMPGVVIVDGTDRVVLCNHRAASIFGDLAGSTLNAQDHLPAPLESLVPELRERLRGRSDTTTVALLTVDVCVRACLLAGATDPNLLLLFERVHRRDAVAANIEQYSLTARERDVVMLVCSGYQNRRIADQLFLAEYTVEDHLKRIYMKIGVRSRTALAAKVLGWRSDTAAG